MLARLFSLEARNKFKKRLVRAFESKRTREERLFEERRRANNAKLREQMKPDDGVVGYIFDTDKPQGDAIAVDLAIVNDICDGPRRTKALDRRRIRQCAKAFAINNDLRLMATLRLEKDGSVSLVEGNHRLDITTSGPGIVNVIKSDDTSTDEHAALLTAFKKKCRTEELELRKHAPAIYCNVDFDDSGHLARFLEERCKQPYYTAAQCKLT